MTVGAAAASCVFDTSCNIAGTATTAPIPLGTKGSQQPLGQRDVVRRGLGCTQPRLQQRWGAGRSSLYGHFGGARRSCRATGSRLSRKRAGPAMPCRPGRRNNPDSPNRPCKRGARPLAQELWVVLLATGWRQRATDLPGARQLHEPSRRSLRRSKTRLRLRISPTLKFTESPESRQAHLLVTQAT